MCGSGSSSVDDLVDRGGWQVRVGCDDSHAPRIVLALLEAQLVHSKLI